MNLDLAKDRFVTHSILNYLSASHQGKFALLNLFAQLEHPGFNQEELALLQQSLSRINIWLHQLYHDEVLFSANWSIAETFEAKHALDMLESLREELYPFSNELARILVLPELPTLDEIKFLLAAFGRHAYARDVYVRGFLDYGKVFGLPEMLERYQSFMPRVEDDVQHVAKLLNVFRSANMNLEQVGTDFFAVLHGSCAELPAIFRTHIHDINQLVSPYKGGFTFQIAQFSKAESDAWQSVGFGPVAAGYWRAYGVSPEEAKSWTEARFTDVPYVYQWRIFGFNPQTATPWAELSFEPSYAFEWFRAQYSAGEARDFIERGVRTPPPKEKPME